MKHNLDWLSLLRIKVHLKDFLTANAKIKMFLSMRDSGIAKAAELSERATRKFAGVKDIQLLIGEFIV